ncbi:MAG: hypothetical protein ACRDHI_13725 [Actinomycetota bacterium]
MIWAMTNSDFSRPIFSIAGREIGLAFHAWDTYADRKPAEERVRREMERLEQKDRG